MSFCHSVGLSVCCNLCLVVCLSGWLAASLSLCLSFLSGSLFICLVMWLSIGLSVCLIVGFFISDCLPVWLSAYLSTCLISFCLWVCSSLRLFVFLVVSFCLSVCMCFLSSVCGRGCVSASLSLTLPRLPRTRGVNYRWAQVMTLNA